MTSESELKYEFTQIHIWYDGPQFFSLKTEDGRTWWGLGVPSSDSVFACVIWSKDDPENIRDILRDIMKNAKCYHAILGEKTMTMTELDVVPEEYLVGESKHPLRLSVESQNDHGIL